MRLAIISLLLVGLLSGCSTFIPKKVELGQDKVQKFPEKKSSEREVQRQAADRAARESLDLLITLLKGDVPTNVVDKAEGVARITDSVSDSLGPPLSPNSESSMNLVNRLNRATAKLDERVIDFKDDNNENAGKKIEGTGWFQVSYVAWVGGALFLLVVGVAIMKVVMQVLSAMNPGVALGTRAAALGGKALSTAFSQVVKGGQDFKKSLGTIVNDESLRQKIVDLFTSSHKKAQDETTKQVVNHLTEE